MAVFLVNQCTFSKLPNITSDQQTAQNISNGASPNNQNQNSNDSTSNLSATSVSLGSLTPSNICGLKFDSLFELIHHIEDKHITDVDYQTTTGGLATGPFYNGHQQCLAPNQPGGMVATAPIRESNIYNANPHDRHHMSHIINGGWLPTSCILRIFNSTHKPHKQQPQPQPQPQPIQQPLTPQQPLSVEMVQQNPQICAGPTSIDSGNSHHIILASPKVVGNLNGASYHVTSSAITTTQSNVATVTSAPAAPINQAMNNPQQQVNVNYSIQQQQLQLQLPPPQQQQQVSQQPQPQPPQQQQQHHQPQQQQQPPQQQPMLQSPQIAILTAIPKPTKVYKCTDCSKTYKTMHGLRTHQNTHHPNSPQTDVKAIALMPESGDTPSGSPAPLSQQQQHQQQQQQQQQQHQHQQQMQPQPITVDMVPQSPQICTTPGIDAANSHHIILASPKIVGNLNGTSYHVTGNSITAPPPVTSGTTITGNQTLNEAQQQVNVYYSIPQQQQLQQQGPPPQQQQQQTQIQQLQPPQQQPQPIQSPQVPTPAPMPKPTKVYKCTDCSKTYKTMHGLRTHQNTHHPNSPQTDGKAMAIMPEGGDTPSGSPADIPQQQSKIPQQ